MNIIIEALLEDCTEPYTLPVPSRDDELLKAILSDNFVTLRAQALMTEHFAAEAIKKMHPAERIALRKRVGLGPRPAHHQVGWKIAAEIQSGKPNIRGVCGRCGDDCLFNGTPDAARTTTWAHCSVGPSRIPESIIEEYAAKFGFTS